MSLIREIEKFGTIMLRPGAAGGSVADSRPAAHATRSLGVAGIRSAGNCGRSELVRPEEQNEGLGRTECNL